jgi:aspartate/methionine/tyrosine aminotransferase
LFLWGRIPDTEVGSEALADRMLREARVFLTPGFIFGSNGDRYIRISLCAPVSKLNEALKRITNLNK